MKPNMNVNNSNGYDKAFEERDKNQKSEILNSMPIKKRERKEQMSIVLTPTDKVDLRRMSDNEGISASELIANWIKEKR